MPTQTTVNLLSTMMTQAAHGIPSYTEGWPHPSSREEIAPVRRLGWRDLRAMRDRCIRRGVPAGAIVTAIDFAATMDWTVAAALDALDSMGPKGEILE